MNSKTGKNIWISASSWLLLGCVWSGCYSGVEETQKWLSEHGQGLDEFRGRLSKVLSTIPDSIETSLPPPSKPAELEPPFVECESDYRDQDCNALFVSYAWAQDPANLETSARLFYLLIGGPTLSLRNLHRAQSGEVFSEDQLQFNELLARQTKALRYLVIARSIGQTDPVRTEGKNFTPGFKLAQVYLVDLVQQRLIVSFAASSTNSSTLMVLGKSKKSQEEYLVMNLNSAAEIAIRSRFVELYPNARTSGGDPRSSKPFLETH